MARSSAVTDSHRSEASLPKHGKLLILTPTAPSEYTTGGRFVRKMLKSFDKERTALVLINSDEQTHSIDAATLKLKLPGAPVIKNTEGPLSKAEETVYWLFRQRFFKRLQKLIPQITEFAGQNQVSHIVSIIDHPATIWIVKRLADSVNVPYSTFTSLLPETILPDLGYDERSTAQVLRLYSETQKAAVSAGFASMQMADHYRTMCSQSPVVLNPPFEWFENSDVSLINKNRDETNTLTIGCILEPRHLGAIHSMISACQDANWNLAGRDISLRLTGSAVRVPFNFGGKPASIEILGGLTERETIGRLTECTVNFLPDLCTEQFSLTAKLCYPDNLPLYAAAQQPIIAMSVTPSLLEETVRAFSLGDTIAPRGENLFIQALKKLSTPAHKKNTVLGFQRLKQERFSESLFSAGLQTLLPGFSIEKNSNV